MGGAGVKRSGTKSPGHFLPSDTGLRQKTHQATVSSMKMPLFKDERFIFPSSSSKSAQNEDECHEKRTTQRLCVEIMRFPNKPGMK